MAVVSDMNPTDIYYFNKLFKYHIKSGNFDAAREDYTLINSDGNLLTEGVLKNETPKYLTLLAESYLNKDEVEKAKEAAKLVMEFYHRYDVDLFDFHLFVYEELNINAYIDLVLNCINFQESEYKRRVQHILDSF